MSPLPNIVISKPDHARLTKFIGRHGSEFFSISDFLERELERARVVHPYEVPRDVVTMDSQVRFRSASNERTVTLVYPEQADILKGRLSILTPVGVALLGLAAGESMEWRGRTGEIKTLTVQQVIYQPEAVRRAKI